MKTKQIVQEYLKRILSAFILFVLFFPATKVDAAVTQEEAGAAIASFAIDFCNKYGDRVRWYDVNLSNPSSYGLRGSAYQEATVGSMSVYYMDCVGWVSYAIHHATGLDDAGPRSGIGSFVSPTTSGGDRTHFEDVTGQDLMPGDILVNSHHVMVYVGDNKLIDSRSSNGLTYTTLEEYGNVGNYTPATYGGGRWGVYDFVYRIKASSAAGINPSDLAPIISGLNSANRKKDYNYYGLPKQGEYVGSRGTLSLLKSIINILSQIADYLIGLLTMGIKIQLIGWTTLIENLITDVVNEVTGTELQSPTVTPNPSGESSTEDTESLYTPDSTETVTGYFTDKNDRLTVEKIIYNQVPIFDVNIFNVDEAGGQQLEPNGTLATIKKNIAKWYYVFRNIAIIGLLLVLLYIGIRMAISTVASEKAVYKKYLKDWIVSFIVVFFIHYIMIFILNINEYLVELLKNSSPNSEYFLYETVRTKAYELKFTSGMAGTVMYMVLVYLMIRYIFIYMKRYLTINILAVIAPIIGITYSIDKIKDSKSQSFSAWLQDFTFTTLLQSVHALIYTMFIPIALDASEENIGGIIFAFILLNFMASKKHGPDKILTDIFGMSGGKSLKNILKGDTVKELFAKYAALRTVGGLYASGARFAGRTIKGVGTTVGQIGGIVIPKNTRYRFNNWYNNTADRLLGENNFIDKRRTSDIETVSDIDRKISAKKLEARKAFKAQAIAPLKLTKAAVTTGFGVMAAIPAVVVEGPISGTEKILKYAGATKIMNSYIGKKSGEGSLNNAVGHTAKKRKLNLLGGTLTGMTVNAVNTYVNIGKTSKATLEKQQSRFSRSISMLEQAQSLEESIITKYANMTQSVNDRLANNQATPAAAKVPAAILAKLNDQYDKMIDEIFKEVEEAEVRAAIEEFIELEKTTSIQSADVDVIVTMLQSRLDKKKGTKIKLDSTELRSNIDEAIEESVNDKLAKGLQVELKKADVSMDDVDAATQKNIIKDIKQVIATTDDEQTIFDAIDNSLEKNGVTVSIGNDVKHNIIKNLKRRMGKNKKEEKVYSPTEIVDIIKKGLDKKGSIEREDVPAGFEEIAEDMENLREVNNQYGKDFGKKIFTRKEIIKAMKETKNAKKFNLYDSIMSGEE